MKIMMASSPSQPDIPETKNKGLNQKTISGTPQLKESRSSLFHRQPDSPLPRMLQRH
ncbi:hypothetical protein E2C01_057408 [Portunus trituberculatus]|uniref:Uncharacterized protein n=1 Tax=Portunus trituberculatus TaxID=210409 RepID=A0A5B7GST5_PORTR|nr:hypothetical protein [Portunus trituberculatus]